MANVTKDYVMRMSLDSSRVLRQYEKLQRDMAKVDKKFAMKTGRSGGGVGSGRFRNTSRAANMMSGIRDTTSGLDRINTPGLDPAISSRIGQLQQQLRGVGGQIGTAKSRKDVANLSIQYRKATSEANQLINAQRRLNKQLTMGAQVGDKFFGSLKRAGLQLASVYAAFEAGRVIFNIGKDMDSMRAGLMAASDSAAEADQNFKFLKDTANKLGQDIQVGVRGFNRLAVAARGAGMSTEEAREIFSAASEASATFQLDAQRSNLVMLAFSQMMSKGKVSAEELNRQMSEQLPIAMQAAEMATGKSAGEIFKMMEQGKLLSKDFVLPFARAMRLLVRENDALATAQDKMASHQARMSNAFKIMIDEIFQGKGAKAIGAFFKRMSQLIKAVSPAVVTLSNMLFEVFEMAVEATSAIAELTTAVLGLAGAGDTMSRGWHLTKAFFHGLASVIWEVIGAAQLLGETLSGDAGFSDLLNAGDQFMSKLTFGLSDRMQGNTSGGGTTISIDKMEVNNPHNMDDIINEMTAFQGL